VNTSLKRQEFALNSSIAAFLLLCFAALVSKVAGDGLIRAGMLFGLALLGWALLLGFLHFLESRRQQLPFPYRAGDLIRVGLCIQTLSMFPIARSGGNIIILLVFVAVFLAFCFFVALCLLFDGPAPNRAEWVFGFSLLVFVAFKVPLDATITDSDRRVIGHPREPASYNTFHPIRLGNMRTLNESEARAELEVTSTKNTREIRIVSLHHKNRKTTIIKNHQKPVRMHIPVQAFDDAGKSWVVTLLETKTPVEREEISW
jgi:hypothetical protein